MKIAIQVKLEESISNENSPISAKKINEINKESKSSGKRKQSMSIK